MYLFIAKIFKKLSNIFNNISDYFNEQLSTNYGSKLIKLGIDKSIYQTKENIKLWLGGNSTIDNIIISTGLWEPNTTELVKQLINKNDLVLDIGANIGYFTTLFAQLIGKEGKVYAFEPVSKYFNLLNSNIELNNFSNIEVIKEGLSNKKQELEINIDDSSATIHQPIIDYIKSKEQIKLTTLDDFVHEHGIKKIDFIKIDIDGHEPFVLEGAIKSIQIFKPLIILEINHLNYFEAGITAWDFYEKLKFWGFHIYHEKDKEEIKNKTEFLVKCGDFSHSSNILICLESINLNKIRF